MRKIITFTLFAFAASGCSAMTTHNATSSPETQPQAQHKAERTRVFKGYGLEFKRVSDDEAYINGKRAQVTEREPTATVYSEAQYMVIYYHKGKATLSTFNRFIGYLKE